MQHGALLPLPHPPLIRKGHFAQLWGGQLSCSVAFPVPLTSTSSDSGMDEDENGPGIYDYDDEGNIDYTISDDEAATAH